MSKTIDQRIVEMRFDNKHFESNVQTSLSTLDKLKRSLNLSSASKGLEGINAAAKNVNLNGLGAAVETVRTKFSALEVMGVTTLANITNSAVNAGKRMVSALTIDPVKTGLSEYETKINAIQVIESNTRGKNTMDDITTALDDLNEYADKTIYNFAQMTSNIGKFTAQGLDVYAAANAVKGMANLAAASGASAEDMSRATYQMSQALSSSIKLMDWNSLRNANMATTTLKETLIELARVHGVAIDDMIEKEGAFEQTLSTGWLTGEMFTEAMNIYSGIYSDAELAAMGFNEKQIANFKDLAKNAESAATEVKTFTQLWDVLKETAQSGWTQSWEILVGDFATAKKDLTQLQVFLSDIINGWSNARNFVLEGVMNFTKPWTTLMDKLEGAGLTKIKDIAKNVSDAADKVKYFQEVVSGVWHGDYNNRGDNPDRFDLLTAAGYDPRVVQDLVNKGLGYEITFDDVVASHEKYGLTLDATANSADKAKTAVIKLSDEQLRNAGLTEDEIELYRALEKEADRLGISVDELAEKMSKNDGRSLMIDSLKNIWDALSGLANAAKTAWVDIFDPPNSGELVVILYNAIDAVNRFTEKLRFTDKETGELTETAEKFIRIFKGVFAAVDVVATILGGGLKIAFKAVTALIDYFGIDVLELAAKIGDAIVKFDEWLNSIIDFEKVAEFIGPYIEDAAKAIKDWFTAFKDSEALKVVVGLLIDAKDAIINFVSGIDFAGGFSNFITGLKDIGSAIGDWIVGLKDTDNIPQYIIEGLVNGLKYGAIAIGKAAIELAKSLWEAFCNFLGIESPSKKFIEAGEYTIDGLLIGLQNGVGKVVETVIGIGKSIVNAFKSVDFSPALDMIKSFWNNIIDFVKAIDWDKVISIVVVGALLATVKKVADTLSMFAKPLDGLGEMFEGIGKAFEGLGASFKAAAWKKKSQAILKLAIAIGVLAGSVYILSKIEPGDLIKAGIALAVLVGVIGALALIASKMDKIDDIGVKAGSLLGISASLLIVALALKSLSTIGDDKIKDTVKLFATVVGGLIGILAAYGLLIKGKAAQNIDKAGATIFKISLALLLMTFVIKRISQLDEESIKKGAAFMGGFIVFVGLLIKATKSAGKNIDKVGSMLIKLTIAMGLMVGVVKLINMLSWEEMGKGAIGMAGFALFVGLLVKVTRTSGKETAKIGGTLLAISASMLILTGVIKLIGNMSWSEIGKGIAGVAALGLLIAGLIYVLKMAALDKDKEMPKLASTLIAMSVAIGILAVIAVALSFVSIEGLAKGIVAVGLLALIMSGMMKAATGLKGGMGTVIALVVAVGILVGAVGVLSLIDTKSLYSAAGAIAIVMGVFALLILSTNKAGAVKLSQLVALVAVVGILALIAVALSKIESDSALENVGALSILLITFAASLAIIGHAGKNAVNASKAMLPMLGVVLVLAIILGAMSALNVEASIPTAGAISILMIAMSTALVIASKAGATASKAVGALMLMGVVVAELAVILGLLAYFDVEPALKTAGSLSLLLIAMSAALVIASMAGPTAASATGALMLMGIVVAELAIVLGLLAYFNVEPSMATVAALSTMLLAMSGALVILNFVGPQAASGVGALMLMGIVVGELAVILGLMAHFDVQPSIETAGALSILLISMSASLVLLGVVGALGPAAFIGIGALATLIAGIGGLVVAIGALVDKFPMLETFLNTGIPIIEKIGYAIGSFFGNIVGGFLGNLTSGLPDMATDLSNFMTNLQPFIEGSKNIDSSVIAGIGYLSGAIIALSVADRIQGITSFIQFGSSLSELGLELSNFMTNALPFITGATMIKPEMMEGVKTLASVILTLTAADILEGLTFRSTGGSSLASFGAQLPQLGSDIAAFATNLGTFDESKATSITCAVNAIKSLATAAESLPNEGGWLAKLVGDNSIATFGSYLPELGTNISTFATNLGTFSEEQVTTVTCAAKAISSLATAAESLPNEGGWAAKILGDNSLATFGSKLPDLGTNLASFVTNLGTFSDDQVTTVKCASNAIKALAQAADALPNEGGWVAKILGDNSLATFGSKLPQLGTDLSGFATNLGTFSEDQVATVTCAANAIKAMANAASSIDAQPDWAKKIFGDNSLASFGTQLSSLGTNLNAFATNLGTFGDDKVATVNAAVKAINAFAKLADSDLKGAKKNLEGFGEKMVEVAKDVKSFVDKMPDTSSLDTAVKNLDKILKAIDDIAGADPDIAVKFTESLSKIGKDAVKKFVEAFTSDSAKSDVKKAAADLMAKVSEGAESKKASITKSLNTIATSCVTGLKDAYQSFYDAGSYLVSGFSAGISENSYKAEAKAKAMATAAADAAKKALDINSPSKVFKEIGSSIPEGFALGIESMGGAVKASVVSMSDDAVNGVGKSISRIADAINTGIDAQPTIRPVLDLSDIESGASTIGDIIGGTSSVGVLSKVGAISTMMNRRNQNGAITDVVSAIETLRRDIGKVGGTTYNSIAGITYDESSSVATAIELITREALKERRM